MTVPLFVNDLQVAEKEEFVSQIKVIVPATEIENDSPPETLMYPAPHTEKAFDEPQVRAPATEKVLLIRYEYA